MYIKFREQKASKKIVIVIIIRMLSTGLKNSILILLIILIFHFLIKNVLLANKETYQSPPQPSTSMNTMPEKEKGGNDTNVPVVAAATAATTVSSKKETYDSWFGTDNTNTTSDDILDSFFKSDVDMKAEAEAAAKCPLPPKNGDLPMSTTCDIDIVKLPADFDRKEIRANCNIVQDKKNVMILNEYENENGMNGGKLFMNLDAYDGFDSSYAMI